MRTLTSPSLLLRELPMIPQTGPNKISRLMMLETRIRRAREMARPELESPEATPTPTKRVLATGILMGTHSGRVSLTRTPDVTTMTFQPKGRPPMRVTKLMKPNRVPLTTAIQAILDGVLLAQDRLTTMKDLMKTVKKEL